MLTKKYGKELNIINNFQFPDFKSLSTKYDKIIAYSFPIPKKELMTIIPFPLY